MLDGLVAAAVLSHDNVWRFRGLTLWQLRLGGPQGYPGVTDTWLTCFVAARLTVLDLGGCSQVNSSLVVVVLRLSVLRDFVRVGVVVEGNGVVMFGAGCMHTYVWV